MRPITCGGSSLESEFSFGRTGETRQIAERALGRLLDELDRDLELIVLGGLVPEVLTSGLDESIPKHMGTADVDLLVNVIVDAEADLVELEAALEQAEFEPDPKQPDGWRWRTTIEGLTVKVDLLCDLETVRSEMTVRPDGCERLGVYNLRGTGYVARDFTWEEIAIASGSTEPARYRVRFAGLAGYLLAKAHAARHRGFDKDYYDLVHVLLYNKAGGPAEAAAVLRSDEWADALAASQGVLGELGARFSRPADRAPRAYAAGALQVDPGGDETALRRDAVAAVNQFLGGLGVS
jgi:hypothetical protein